MSLPAGELAFYNGKFLPRSDVSVPIHDAGFVFGAIVTDLCRTFHHQLFRLPDHLSRFRASCNAARIPQPINDRELTRLAETLVKHNAKLLSATQELALVMIATPGPLAHYAGHSQANDPSATLIMHTFPLSFHRFAGWFRDGARLIVPARPQVPARCVDPNIKQRSRLHWWIAEQEVHEIDPQASALLLDEEDCVTETAAANFLIVRRATVVSPPADRILAGVSRLVVTELCAQLKIPFVEEMLSVEDCLGSDEAMLCGTSFCLAGIQQINGKSISWPGPLFQRLLNAWSAMVGLNIQAQIEQNGVPIA